MKNSPFQTQLDALHPPGPELKVVLSIISKAGVPGVLFSGWDGALKSLAKICKYFLCFNPEWTLLLCTPGFHGGKPQHSKHKEKPPHHSAAA